MQPKQFYANNNNNNNNNLIFILRKIHVNMIKCGKGVKHLSIRRQHLLMKIYLTLSSTGETSAGKSSLINLLLNEQVLPTSVLQNTLTICEISYGAKREAVIHFGNKEKTSLRLGDIKSDTLKQYIQKPTNDKDWCKKIEIKIPNSLLKVI